MTSSGLEDMGKTTDLRLCVGILLLCINLASSAIKIDSGALGAFKEVKQGSKSYAVFRLDNDQTTVVLDKSSGGDFSSLTTDLTAAKKAAQARYAVFSTMVKGENKLIFIAWTPSSASVSQCKTYKDEADDTIEAFNADIWVLFYTGSVLDLNLEAIVQNGLAGYNVIESSEYFYDIQETVTLKETVTVERSVTTVFSKLTQGSCPYVVIDISSDFSTVTVEQIGEPGDSFNDLVSYLKSCSEAKFALLSTNVKFGDQTTKKLILIDWIPRDTTDADRVKIRALVPKLKTTLKTDFLLEFPTSSSDDLDLDKIVNLAVGGKVQTPSGNVEFTFDNEAKGAIDDLSKLDLRYVLFKFSNDLSNIVVDKVASLKADFNAFMDDLISVQNNKQPRYAIYLTPIRTKGKVVQKLISFLWAPFSVPEKLRSLYETNFPSFKVLSKAPIVLNVTATSVCDLNLDAILKVALGKDFEGQGNLGGDILGEPDDNVPNVKFDMEGTHVIKQLFKGMKRYVTLSLNNGLAVLDKFAPIDASFGDLKTDLVNAQEMGQAKYAIFLAPVSARGKVELKPFLITWAPLNVANKMRLLYIKSVPKFKSALELLGLDIWSDFTVVTLDDLELGCLVKTGLKNNLLKLSLGSLSLNLGTDILNPAGAVGCLLGSAGNLAGGLTGAVLGLGQGIIGGVLNFGVNLINGFFGGILGGKFGLSDGLFSGKGGLFQGPLSVGHEDGEKWGSGFLFG